MSKSLPTLEPGAFILIGTPGITPPSEWFLAKVLWADSRDVLYEHEPIASDLYRDVADHSMVRAYDRDTSALFAYRDHCARALQEQKQQIDECLRMLGDARASMWAALDKISDAPQVECAAVAAG